MLRPIENEFRTVRSVDGFWNYRFDTENEARSEHWQKGFTASGKIPIQASWNELFATYEQMYFMGECWYAKKHFVPASWAGQRVVLRVGSVSYKAQVWVNGSLAGSYEGCHMPFEFDVTELVTPGSENLIVIAVDAELSDQTLPVGAIEGDIQGHSTLLKPYPNVNFDFFPYGGVHRPVELYTTGEHYIDGIAVDTDIDGSDGVVDICAKVAAPDGAVVEFELAGTTQTAAVSGGVAEAKIIVENATLWSCRNPHLYELKVNLSVGGEKFDSYKLNIGIRTIEVTDSEILLNGERVFLRGFGKHEDFPVLGKGLNHAVIVKDYELMKWVGANSYRTTHYPYSEDMLDMADEQGFLVISETAAVGLVFDYDTSELAKKHKVLIDRLIERDRNHPSVIMWCLANEPRSDNPKARPYFEELIAHTRKLDSKRPLTIVTCDGPWVGRGQCSIMDLCDVVCLNRYYGWYVGAGRLDVSIANMKQEMQEIHDRCKRPIIITEFGADCVAGLHAQPSFVFSEEYQSELLEKTMVMLESLDFCAGEHIWNFADFMTGQVHSRVVGNKKGIFTRDRAPKMAAHTVKRLWSTPHGQ